MSAVRHANKLAQLSRDEEDPAEECWSLPTILDLWTQNANLVNIVFPTHDRAGRH